MLRRTGHRLVRRLDRLRGRPVPPCVIFIHTPKTGGNSINSYFKEYVGSKRSGHFVRYDDFGPERMNECALRARAANYVTGHMPWTTLELCRDENTFTFTVLRDPYERLRSLYYFIVNLPDSYPREESVNWMQTLSLPDFLSSNDARVRVHTDNYIVRQFSGNLLPLPERGRLLDLAETAIQNLSTLDLIGFNDDIEGVFGHITEIAGLPRPPLGRRINVTAALSRSDTAQAAAMRPFDEEMRALALPLVEADMIVFRHFCRCRTRAGGGVILNSRLQHHPSHHAALAQIVEGL